MLAAAADSLYRNSGCPKPGAMEEEEDDYENEAPPYKDLPPKPGWMAPPRPPRAGEQRLEQWKAQVLSFSRPEQPVIPPSPGKNMESAPLPPKPRKITALAIPADNCSSGHSGMECARQAKSSGLVGGAGLPSLLPGVDLEPPLLQPSQTAPVHWLIRKPRACSCHQERLTLLLCALAVAALLLSFMALALTLTKYQEVVEKVRTLTLQQTVWRENLTGVVGLAGLKKDIDRVRADTNHSLVELWGLLDRPRIICPDDWLPFEGKCYYFSPSTKTWDEARKFCQESYSHLVIINSFAEHTFVTKAHGSPRVYWLGLSDKNQEGDWRWLDGSPVTLSFWDPQEPNNSNKEDCASMNRGGTWNDLSCAKTTYWICERQCSC